MFLRNSEEHAWRAKRSAKPSSLRKRGFPKPLPNEGQKIFMEVNIIEEKKKGFRARPYAYSFRASAEEKELLESKVTASGLNKTDYLIKCLSDKPIVTVPNDLLLELKRQGNNLNQVVKNCYYGKTTERELLSCVSECKRLYGKMLSAIGES